MGYRFAICDDDEAYAQYIDGLAARWARQAGEMLETERFPSAEAFLFQYGERKDFDVLLLDIEMTGMDGVELAKTVRRGNDDVQIVFVTGYTDYIAEGYEVSAVHAGQDYTVKRPLGEMEKELDSRFFRVGRSYILNLACVQRVSRTEAELTSGERIPLPRGQYEKLNRAIIERM